MWDTWTERHDTLVPNYKVLDAFVKAGHKSKKLILNEDTTKILSSYRLLAFDPGETTGVAFWNPPTPFGFQSSHSGASVVVGQINTKSLVDSFHMLNDILAALAPAHVRQEDYKVYAWKAEDHTFSSLHTPKLVGLIEVCSAVATVPETKQLAQQAKAFWTDDKLKAVGLYAPGMRHGRDAVRHLLYLMTFNPEMILSATV